MTVQEFPFTISKRKDSKFYSVRFKDEINGGYLPAISTKQTDKREAIKTALEWYSSGRVNRANGKKETIENLSIYETLRKSDIGTDEADKILSLLTERGILKSYVKAGTRSDIPFSRYLETFWTWDKSEYIMEKLKCGKNIGKSHVEENFRMVGNYWTPYFKDALLGELTRQSLKDFQSHLMELKISNATRNHIWLCGAQALRYAYQNELIDRDITAGLTGFYGKPKPRDILTPELAEAVFSVQWTDSRAYLANLLAMCTGMRAGEIRALRKMDLGEGCIYVNHSWNDSEGLKAPKNGETRIVQLPFPQITRALLELADTNPFTEGGMEGFIFYATIPGKPLEIHVFLDGLRAALAQTGMDGAETKKYCFHSWRHFYAAYMKDHVNAKLLQSQTGHKTLSMLEHYANHKISGDDERIQAAQTELFGGIVKNAHIDFDKKQLYGNIPTGHMDKAGLYEHSRQFRAGNVHCGAERPEQNPGIV